MKSQKSLNNIASADLKRSFASNLVIPALTFLAFTVQAAVCAYFQFKQKEKVFFTWFMDSPDALVFISFCVVLVGAIQAAYTLRFINIKNQSNVWFSFNLSRSTLFKNRCVSSLTLLSAAIIIPGIISVIICCASGCSAAKVLPVIFYQYAQYAGFLTMMFAGFAIGALTASLTGSVAESIFYSVVLILALPLLSTAWDALSSVFLRGRTAVSGANYADGMDMQYYYFAFSPRRGGRGIMAFCPFTLFRVPGTSRADLMNLKLRGFGPIDFGFCKDGSSLPGIDAWLPILLWIVLTAVLIVLAQRMFGRKKLEELGVPAASRVLTALTSAIIVFCGFSVPSWVLKTALPSVNTALAALLGAAVMLAAYFAYTFIARRNLKAVRKNLWQFAMPVGAAAIITAIFLTGGFGYTARVPEAEEVEYVTVSMPFSFESGMAQNGSILRTVKGTATVVKPYSNCITLSTEKDINTVLSIHKLITTEKKSDEKTSAPFSVKYYFKNGRSMERTFTNISEKDLNTYFAVADADEVKKQQYLFLAASDTEREELENESVKAPGMSNSQGYFFFQNYGSPLRNAKGALIASKDGSFCRELSSDELDKLGKCIWGDISKKKYTDILRGSEKEVAYIYLIDNATSYDGRYEENVEGRSVLAAVTDDMTETLKFIKEHGMADALGQKREVKSVNIYDCRRIISKAKEINKNGSYGGTAINPIFIMSTMFNTKEIKLVNKTFGDMDDCFIKSVTNQKQSDELFALAQGQCYTSLGGYIVQITFTDGYNQTMYISESDAPGYIK